MAINKVIFGGEVKLDLTSDTVSADKVLKDIYFHGKDGVRTKGTCTFDANTSDATATVDEVLATKTFYGQGVKKTGTMKNNGAISGTISTKDGKYTVGQGYHDGSGTVQIDPTAVQQLLPENIRENCTVLGIKGTMSGSEGENAEETKTVTPTTSQQTITPSSGFTCMREVIVNAIPYVESANAYGTTVTIG